MPRPNSKSTIHNPLPLVEDILLILVLLRPWTDHSNLRPLGISANRTAKSHFYSGATIYAAATTLKLLSELLYIRVQNSLRLNIRLRAEGIAIVV